MKELLCINDTKIKIGGITYSGESLKEGQTYFTRGKIFETHHGVKCYYIEGLGIRLACRFTELLDNNESEIMSIKKLLKTEKIES